LTVLAARRALPVLGADVLHLLDGAGTPLSEDSAAFGCHEEFSSMRMPPKPRYLSSMTRPGKLDQW
jgi:hypothetical protein